MGRKRYRGRNILRKVDPNTGFLETIDRDTGETLEVDTDYVRPEDDNLQAPPQSDSTFYPPGHPLGLQTEPSIGNSSHGSLNPYVRPGGYMPPVEHISETTNSANKDAIIKQLNEKYPTHKGITGFTPDLVQHFKYNPYTDSFDPYVTHAGKEYSVSEINDLNHTIANLPKGLNGGGSGGLLGSLNDLVNNVKGSLTDLTNVDLADIDLTDLDLSGGHSVNTEQDLTEVDLQEQVTEGLESITDAGTTAVEQLAEGSESLNELIDATVTGAGEQASEFGESANEAVTVIEEQIEEGVESAEEAAEVLELDEFVESAGEAATGLLGIDKLEEMYQGSMLDRILSGEITIDEAIALQYQGGDVDQILEMGQYLLNEVDRLRKGETTQTEETVTNASENLQEVSTNIQETGTNLGNVVEDTFNTGMNVSVDLGSNAADQVIEAKDDVVQAFVDAGILTPKKGTQGGGVDPTRGGDVLREEDLFSLNKKKSTLKAKKKAGKKGLRIDYGVSVPGGGKSGIAA